MRHAVLSISYFLAVGTAVATDAPRTLTFEERVRAQEAIERVYRSHRIGGAAPSDDALPLAAIEGKVRRYLGQSDVLAVRWNTVLDDEMLQREMSVARYVVPKTRWDAWWEAAKPAGDGGAETTLAADRGPLPRPSIGSAFASESGTQGSRRSSCAADDTWDNGVLGDLPDPRSDHAAVWTGSFMVVWGGSSGFSGLDTGGRYDQTTDSWTPTSTTGAPAARMAHTAVWTGTRMLVWGGSYFEDIDGHNYVRFRQDGAQYDPATDTWSQLSIIGAPSARYDHTAIWTGERMVVWGGHDSNTGGRYDPAIDQWIPTSTESAPSARFRHSAVWTGREMVVWGGSDSITIVNSGGRYDPSTDHWTPTPSTGAPTARDGHTAVWTGTRMIVWGGMDPSSPGFYLQSGALYDPATNVWAPTPISGAPSARIGHSAVWTGSRLVIWGGSGGSFLKG